MLHRAIREGGEVRGYAAGERRRPRDVEGLPEPFDSVPIVQPGPGDFPGQLLPAIAEEPEVLRAEGGCPIRAALGDNRPLAESVLGEDDGDLQLPRAVIGLCLPPFVPLGEAV